MRLKWAAVAAVASMGNTAHAQSSVTLYGAIDSGLLYQNTSAASFSAAAKNLGGLFRMRDAGIYSSNFGITGTEDIGAGYHVNFKLQGTFDTTNGRLGLSDTAGQRALFNQFATVGVGIVRFGERGPADRAHGVGDGGDGCARWPVVRQHSDRVAWRESGGRLDGNQYQWPDRCPVRQQCNRL